MTSPLKCAIVGFNFTLSSLIISLFIIIMSLKHLTLSFEYNGIQRADGRFDGQTRLQRCDDASQKTSNTLRRKENQRAHLQPWHGSGSGGGSRTAKRTASTAKVVASERRMMRMRYMMRRQRWWWKRMRRQRCTVVWNKQE